MQQPMRRWALLDALPEPERHRVLVESHPRRFARNEVIFHHGDPGDCLHLVGEGHVGIRIFTPLGDIATVRLVKPGEFFGELAVVSPGPRNATAVALDRVETLVLSRRQLEEMRVKHDRIDALIIEALATEVRRLANQVVDVMYLPAEKRLWRTLAELTITYGSSDAPASSVPLTQEVLAQLTGCTRPTVNRILRGGEQLGILRLEHGSVDVLDHNSLSRRGQG
jgi:CRP/FNR family transcriptional regulator, cyclic AMP receptor protein